MILTTSNMTAGLQSLITLVQILIYLAGVSLTYTFTDKKSFTYITTGLGLTWVIAPNRTVFLGETFNVSYKAIISDRFYRNMAISEYFPNMK